MLICAGGTHASIQPDGPIPEAKMVNPWSKPVFQELDVSGECTAYAGAQRAETLACEPRAGRSTAAHRDLAATDRPLGGGTARAPRRDAGR
jgi:hypothetical protein